MIRDCGVAEKCGVFFVMEFDFSFCFQVPDSISSFSYTSGRM